MASMDSVDPRLLAVIPEAIREALGPLVGSALAKKIDVEELGVREGSVKEISIGEVEILKATVGNVSLGNAEATVQSGALFLRTVRATIELQLKLDWSIDLGFLGSWSGSENLPTIGFGPIGLGDISLPSLPPVTVTIPEVTLRGLEVPAQKLRNLRLGKIGFEKLSARRTTLPAAGFSLNGLALGSFNLARLGVPGALTDSAGIKRVTPEGPVILPGLSLPALRIPAVKVPSLSTESFSTGAVVSAKSVEVDLGVLEVTLSVLPELDIDVQKLEVRDLSVGTNVGSVSVSDVGVQARVHDITADDLALSGVDVESVSG